MVVLWDRECLGDIARRKAFRLMLHQQSEHVQPGGLGERCQRENGTFRFHISRLVDIWNFVKRLYFDITGNTVDGNDMV
jgi:hypothetical protein